MLSTTLYSSTSCDDVRSDVGRDRSAAALSPTPWAPLLLVPPVLLPPDPDAPLLPPPFRWSDDLKELVLASSSWMLSSSRRRSVCVPVRERGKTGLHRLLATTRLCTAQRGDGQTLKKLSAVPATTRS